MKFICWITVLALILSFQDSFSQEPGGQEIAINESQLSYLAPESCNFSEKYIFDMRFNTFKEITYNTYLFLSPSLEMTEIIRPVPRGSIIKAYKQFKSDNSWAVKFENDWGFISADMLKKIEKYEEPLNEDDLDTPPQLLSKLSIKYPSKAKKENIQGEVVLRILVSNTGAVSRVEIEKSIPHLDTAAIHAVEKLRFKPAKKYGMPTDVWVRVPLNFELTEASGK